VNSADRRSDVPVGTMDEASPFRVLMHAVIAALIRLRAGGLVIDSDAPFTADQIFGHKACRDNDSAHYQDVTPSLRNVLVFWTLPCEGVRHAHRGHGSGCHRRLFRRADGHGWTPM
jgi:hypothetical protein